MKTTRSRPARPGYVSYVLVLSTGLILTMLTVYAYRRALHSQAVQSEVQLRIDYAEKEEAILRSIVAITPNRAIRAMMHNSNVAGSENSALRWQAIFTEALAAANASNSIPHDLLASLNLANHRISNTGDSQLGSPDRIFRALNGEPGYVSPGINRSLGTGFPSPLSLDDMGVNSRDQTYPVIARAKYHGALAQSMVQLPVSAYPQFNIYTYPQINFNYARPGDPFVAKRNWWAFSMNVAAHEQSITRIHRPPRNFVLSIYEIPSQLAISADSFMSLGRFESGEPWQNVNIAGGVYASRAVVEGSTVLPALSGRRGISLSRDATIGGESFHSSPFSPGVREQYQISKGGFLPVSLASESGRVAFIPINRGADFFDRFAHTAESQTVSPTTWNNYSAGALQCAMRLDITDSVSSTNPMPTRLRFSAMRGSTRHEIDIPVESGALPQGTPAYPFEIKKLPSSKLCVAVYPQRIPAFLNSLNVNRVDHPTFPNNSLVVNVDYSTSTGSIRLRRPSIPCTDLDYGLILEECANLSDFTRGFSLVSNLRAYIGDDFNIVPITPPVGYTPVGTYHPPVSLFVPERRYGVNAVPFGVRIDGQIGSIGSGYGQNPTNPIESHMRSGRAMSAGQVTVNLRPITHPAELPPVTMMNWLVVLEEQGRRHVAP